MMKRPPVPRELLLRHLTVEEAIRQLDEYLDAAFMAELWQVRVVHGKGGGRIRKAVDAYLKKHPLVISHRLGYEWEGSYGTTIVNLEQKKRL